ncbi:outer membrane receptor protein involved in Fe transport [Myroides gitamensis]|uniref:TonB-dependent receptor domain-containing protein n=1 Tax=Myroides odoratus TaxID=256 RepID=UPI002167FF08|nr:TonB-dependent receptor [Myroides odoratus]MCS4238096.1 outer membrane receptor protein involved in Fe transport [Myroides odoratus]MDH6600173.1 outer membrane receptor protein involved in Fe transport [Myroides gitamensis]
MYNLSPCYFVFLLIPCLSYGQSFQLQGQVVNSKQQPVEFMDVYLTSSTNSNTPHAYTDSLGNFTLQVLHGNYTLLLIEFGKQKYSQDLVVEQDMNLGKIQVDEGVLLDSITITAKKKLIERKVDRLVFNVENSVSASGGDALDALKVTPSVQVKNDKIAVAGKSNVSILVDDKYIILAGDELIQFLKGITSDNIKSIEVITVPPAKYSAEGEGGLINIKLKKSAPHSWSNTSRTSYTQGTYPLFSLGNNFNYQQGKWSFLVDVSKLQNKTIYTNDMQYYYPRAYWKNMVYNRVHYNGFSSIVNMGYAISDKRKINVQYMGNSATPKIDGEGNTLIYQQENGRLINRLPSVSQTKNKNYNHAFSASLVTQLDTLGKKYTLDAAYFVYFTDKKSKQTNQTRTGDNALINTTWLNNNSTQRIENWATQLDFELPYTWATLEFGAKLSLTKTNSALAITMVEDLQPLNQQVDQFTYWENTQALYFSGTKSFGEKWQVKAGLRAEATQNKGDSFSMDQVHRNKYSKLFPTVYVSYQLISNHDLTLKYSKRIARPPYGNLNPARWYLNTTSYEEGNPFLQPAFNTNVELSHSYKKQFTTTLSYTHTTNGFGQLTIHNEEQNFQKFVRLNYYSAAIANLNFYTSIDVVPWWTNTLEFNTFYTETNMHTIYLKPKYSGWGAYFMSTSSFTLNAAKTLTAEISYEQDFASEYAGNKAGANANVTAGIKLSLLDKKLQCVLNANNILGTDRMLLSNTTQNVFQTFKQYYDTQYVRFSMSYSFGNKNIAVKKQNSSNEEEKGRAN